MSGTINTYTFDFETESAVLLRSLGTTADYMMLVDVQVTAPQPPEALATVDIPGAHCGKGIDGGIANQILGHLVSFYEHYDNPEARGSNHFPMSIMINGERTPLHTIALRNTTVEENFGKPYAGLMRLFSLLHEAGHAVTANLEKEEESPRGEIAADAYAALSLLERFGEEAIPLISQISWLRALNGVHGDTLHLTSFALDKIIVDYNAGKLANLDHDKITGYAKAYAKEWTPETDTLLEARASFMPHLQAAAKLPENRLEALLDSTFLSPPNAIAQYAIGRVAMPFLTQADAQYRNKTLNLTEGKKQEYTSLIRDWAKGGLTNIFGASTAREQAATVLNMQQLRRFPGQHFNYTP